MISRYNELVKYKVIVETGVIDRPQDHEISAAPIVANEYLKTDICASIKI